MITRRTDNEVHLFRRQKHARQRRLHPPYIYICDIPEAITSETNAVVAELACGTGSKSVVMLRGTSTKCTRALDTFYQAMNTNAPYPELDDEWIDYRK